MSDIRVIVTDRGQTNFINIETPKCTEHALLVKTEYSAISPGTEMMMIRGSELKQCLSQLGYSAVGGII